MDRGLPVRIFFDEQKGDLESRDPTEGDLIDTRFGTFTWDAVLEQFMTEHEGVWLHVRSARSLLALHDLYGDLDTLIDDATIYVAKQLLVTRNDMFPEAQQVTADQFVERLKLESLSLDDDGALSLSFDDGGLFHNHIVIVGRDAAGVWQDTYWAG